jgi:hypothetical protein
MNSEQKEPTAVPAFDANGLRIVSRDLRLNAAAQALANDLWRGGSDEQYHFLLYICGRAAATVLAAADRHDST